MTLIKDDFTKEEILYSGMLYTASSIVSKVIVGVSSFYVIYALTIYEYGVYKLILSLGGMFQVFLLSGLDGVVRNDIALEVKGKNVPKASIVFFEYVFFKIILGVVLTAAFLLFVRFFLGYFYDANWTFIFTISAALIVLATINDISSMLFSALGALSLVSKLGPLFDIANFVTIIGIFYWKEPTVYSAILAMIIFQVFQQCVLLAFAWKDIRAWWKIYDGSGPIDLFRMMRTYGKWAVLAQMLGDLLTNGRNYIIKFLISTEAVAIFNVAKALFSNLTYLLPINKILGVFLPYKISETDLKAEYFEKGVRYTTFLYALAVLGGGIGAAVLIPLLIPKYAPSLPIFYFILLSLLTYGVFYMASGYLQVMREQKAFFYRMLLKNISAITLIFLLVPVLGQLALGIEILLTNVLMTVLVYMILIKTPPELKLKLRSFLVTREDIRFLIRLVTGAAKIVRS